MDNMKIAIVLIFFINVLVIPADAQVHPELSKNIAWYDAGNLSLKGKGWDSTENIYERLPLKAKGEVSPQVWRLSKSSAGLYVLFTSDTKSIKVRWKTRFDTRQNLMSPLGLQGVDLYVKGAEGWRWAGSGKPKQKKNEADVISGMAANEKEFMLYLPLYDGVDSVFIGIEKNASVKAANTVYKQKPIFFYGTSITQGASASRPGMAYPSIIGRALDRETINLGFSGNGKMDPGIAKLLSQAEASMFVINCLPNMEADSIFLRTKQLVRKIRSGNKLTPILLVENIKYTHAWLSKKLTDLQTSKNAQLSRAFNELKKEGISEIYYLDNRNLTRPGGEGTVDGVHLTDLGFQHFADVLTEEIKKIEAAKSSVKL